ncbi:MAG: PD40 domain-containing protein [Colwellia sp.]|nr:PD40 domain-containing protein [Colwellia sp.]
MIEFYVGNYRIDMARSQIVAQDDILSMEPKVLQVLLILAENQGQVVPHDVILNKVWPGSVVGSNAIQRCIAQLRKAFNDDAKTQSVISTHPKVGYSLLTDVNWPTELANINNQEKSAEQETEHSLVNSVFIPKHWILISAAILIIIALFTYQELMSADKLNIAKLTPLTATDNKEQQPSYSPDGRYIAFQRYVGSCENQLWAKDTLNNKEYLLTEEVGIYGTPSWSPDGSQIVFSSVTHCSKHQVLEGCEELRALSFGLAKSSPQATREILSCESKDYHSPVWLDNESIAFFSTEDDQDKLLKMSLTDNKISTLYTPQKASLYSLDYSGHLNLLALSQFDAVHNFSLVLVDPVTIETTITALQPEEMHKHYKYWSLSWHPNQESLITSAGKSLYTVDLNGQLTEYNFPAMQNIYGPRYHPQAHSIVAAMGTFDPDIGQLNWNKVEGSQKPVNIVTKQQMLARSTVNEHDAKYQPQGNQIAFISNRGGSSQIWLLNSAETSRPPNQLSYFPADKEVNAFVWSQDGSLMIVNSDRGLTLLDFNGELTPIKMPFGVVDIYHTFGESQLLLKVIENNQYAIKLFNFDSHHLETLYIGVSQKALLTEQGDLFVIDDKLVLKQIVDDSLLPVAGFNESKSFSIFQGKNNNILVTDSHGKLWQFNVDSSLKSLYLASEGHMGTVSDILLNKKTLLFSKMVSIKKEIVLLN